MCRAKASPPVIGRVYINGILVREGPLMLTDHDDDIAVTAWALRRLAAALFFAGIVIAGIAVVVLIW